MSEDKLDDNNYYEPFERGGGWDLATMREVLGKLSIQPEILEPLHTRKNATFLLLGSASSRNLDEMSLIDGILRPGKGDQDTVIVIDTNSYPLLNHQKRIKFLAEWEKSNRENGARGVNKLLYPKFQFVNADMRQLPFGSATMDVVVSDYTFNFLSKIGEIDQSFKEISRVLSPNGLLLFAVKGNKKYPYSTGNTPAEQIKDTQEEELQGKTRISEFPLSTYLTTARNHQLEMVVSDRIEGSSQMFLGVLRKVG